MQVTAVIDDVAAFVISRASHPHSGEVLLVLYPHLVRPADLTPQRVD